MAEVKHQTPSPDRAAFSCPHCQAYSKQNWYRTHAYETAAPYNPNHNLEIIARQTPDPRLRKTTIELRPTEGNMYSAIDVTKISLSQCHHCFKLCIWIGALQVFPQTTAFPPANRDMPESVLSIYNEAAGIAHKSPRGAAALMRLAIDELCNDLGKREGSLFDKIGNLVADGLRKGVQEAFDTIRIIGNDAVHPGQITMEDVELNTVAKAAGLLNMIVTDMYSNRRELEELHSTLTEGQVQAITRRDSSHSEA